MKALIVFLSLWSGTVLASAMADCPYGQVRQFYPQGGFTCVPSGMMYPQSQPYCISCQQQNPWGQTYTQPWMQPQLPWMQQQRYPWMANYQSPWWAQQGQLYYPNFNSPGAWQYPGMQQHYYPGQGQMFLGKPNVYVSTGKTKLTSFTMEFSAKDTANFLATTPSLTDSKWQGTASEDSFYVDGVKYSYLFYDTRADHAQMQYQAGWCTEHGATVKSMSDELKALGFSTQAIKDFDEHWNEKLPRVDSWCVYPQYNQQLDKILPVKLTPSMPFVRVAFVLVPHNQEQRRPASAFPQPPRRGHASLRPTRSADQQVHMMEWGVAFLASELIR